MRVLLTGGMGFIGSHTAVSLLEAGHEPILYDNLSNADRSVVDRIGRITGHTPTFIEGDIRDGALLKQVLRNEHIEAVIHFAGLKAVGESVGKPLEYFDKQCLWHNQTARSHALCRSEAPHLQFLFHRLRHSAASSPH